MYVMNVMIKHDVCRKTQPTSSNRQIVPPEKDSLFPNT
jgi:hypothetical protein